MTYDNIESHKKQGLTLSLEDTLLEETQGGQDPPTPTLHPPTQPFKG